MFIPLWFLCFNALFMFIALFMFLWSENRRLEAQRMDYLV
uniref:Uncharacterized protein n=1 Tax=viral metagenome TaxID=1070528 RepID=A0A6C0AGL4_9ZZZZ